MKRRRALLAAVGAAAAAGGLGAALWQRRSTPGDASPWALAFDRPGGGRLALADFRRGALLLNFWAPWCPPCVTEMPLLDRFHAEHQAAGWTVIGLALDQEAAVSEFLAKRPVGFPIALAGTEGFALVRALGNTAAGLPFSVAYRQGNVLARKLGELDAQTLRGWADSAARAPR